MSFDWADAKERVRQAVDIVELVGEYLQLRREGRGFKAICPWHDDTRPSLQVNPERQSFKCWVCDIGGDVFTFKMKMDNVDFPEAMRMLADKAGIQIAPRQGETGGLSGDEKRDVLQTLTWAEQRFHAYLLGDPAAEPARKYLTERGITLDSIAQFKLGFSPNSWDWLLNQARNSSYTPKLLETAGLVAPRQNGPGHYDRFRGRVLFSIRDPQNRPVGFGGRVLPGISDDNPAKYVNSPETPVFAKSSLLYGLDHAKDAITHSRTAVVMEGYTDVIIAHQCGFKSAVAVLGTALGERHIKLLRRYADRIILLLDGDEAGRRRTDEILELFVAEQVDLRILTLPDELDPADFLLQHGADALTLQLAGAVDALDHKYRTVFASLGSQPGTHQINQAVEGVLNVLAKAPRSVDSIDSAAKMREDQMLVRLAQLSGLDDTRLRQRLTGLRKMATKSSKPIEEFGSPQSDVEPRDEIKFNRAERWLMELLLHAPELLGETRTVLTSNDLRRGSHRMIFAKACELNVIGELAGFDRLMLEFDDPMMKNVLVDLDEERRQKSRPATREELHELLGVLKQRGAKEAELTQLPSPTASSTAGEERRDDLGKLRSVLERERRRHGISAPMDG